MGRELLCRRLDTPGPPWAHVPGSTEATCGTCHAPVWVTPRGREVLAAGAQPLCPTCLVHRPELTQLAVPVAMAREIDQHLMMWERRN